MSSIDLSISNTEVIPLVETDMFHGHEATSFAVGMLAIGDEALPSRDAEYHGYLRLRAGVYAAQTNIISRELVRADGTETDEDDARSVHFGEFEYKPSGIRAVGALRLITKTEQDSRPLPVEKFFPEVFADKPAPLGAVEVSRYICRHESRTIQSELKWPLYTEALGYFMTHNLGPAYGVIEEKIESALLAGGVPLTRIAQPRYVPEYASDNVAVQIDTQILARMMGMNQDNAAQVVRANEQNFTYFNMQQQHVGATA